MDFKAEVGVSVTLDQAVLSEHIKNKAKQRAVLLRVGNRFMKLFPSEILAQFSIFNIIAYFILNNIIYAFFSDLGFVGDAAMGFLQCHLVK
ncbi:hypothetical protein IJT17_00515, partial [bacterium]|nr:hypothetical protein [bacterium]